MELSIKQSRFDPFGLTMAGISSRAAGGTENKYRFNKGTEANTDFDIALFETHFRLYDPQIGRFWQVDELAEINWELTPYNFALDNPIRFNDPFGLNDEDPNKPVVTKASFLDNVTVVGIRYYSHNQLQDLYWRLRDAGKGFKSVGSYKLRERLERWDGIVHFMEKVHGQQREQEEFALEVASWFIPMGWLTKAKYFKYAINLMKFKRGVVVEKAIVGTSENLVSKETSSIFSYIGEKIANQIEKRGWTKEAIHDVVNNPYTTRESVNLATGNGATAFFEESGAYIIKDNITNQVIQISDKLRAWIPDKNIINPYIPK